jgi:uncharacterized protein (DUF849 family)
MEKLIIQVRVNEGQMRNVTPHVPYSSEEIADQAVECWRHGDEDPLMCELSPFGDGFGAFGHPATVKGLQALLDFFPAAANWAWMVDVIGANSFPVLAHSIACGGHVAIGVADHPYRELGFPTNAELVDRVVDVARSMGREVASATEAREMLGFA